MFIGDINENFEAFMNNTLKEYYTTAPSIPSRCFYNKTAMEKLVMTGAIVIEESACQVCRNLQNVYLPEGLEEIRSMAFRQCYSLQKILFPSTLRSIGANCFYQMSSLSVVDLRLLNSPPILGSQNFIYDVSPNLVFYLRDQQQIDEFSAATNWSVLADRFQIKEA